MVDGQHRCQRVVNGQGLISHYQYTGWYHSQPYTKLFAFNTAEQTENHKSETQEIIHLLNTYLEDNNQTPESVVQMVRIVNRFGRKWGYLRVPAPIRLAVNFKQATAGLRLTDYGNDAGVTQGMQYEIPPTFGAEHGASIAFNISDCVPPVQFIHQYNCTLDDREYQKYIPCVDADEEEDFEKQTRKLYRQMYHLFGPLPESQTLINQRRSAMTKLLSKANNYVHKWGLARVPGNIRSSINMYEYILTTDRYTDFGPDIGLLAGSNPYENIHIAEKFEAFAPLVMPR